MNILFYTIIYSIQSKFDFEKYIEWGKNIINYVQNYKLIIFTNKETYKLIKNIIKDKNIEIIILELEEFFYFRYKNFLLQNTNKDCFPDHNISYKLILLWIERHLLIKKIKNKYKSDFYCYIDWGYIREKIDPIKIKEFDLDENKIHWGLVNSKKDAFEYYNHLFKTKDKNILKKNIKDIIINQKIEKYQPIFGGGFSIIPHKMIDDFLEIYNHSLNYILDNQILFKDDQSIIAYTIINNLNKFKLIYKEKDKIEWFPFIYLLK